MSKEYLQYKDNFQRYCVLKLCACLVGAVMLIFMLFLPIFEWENELLAGLIGENKMQFSLFDEGLLALELFKGEEASHFLLDFALEAEAQDVNPLITFLFFGIIFWAGALLLLIIEGVKAVGALLDLEGYTLEQYDKMKWRQDGKKRRWGNFSYVSALVGTVTFFSIYIFLTALILKNDLTDQIISYFTFEKFALTAFAYLTILFVVGALVLEILSKNERKKIRQKIIKADYMEALQVFEEE